MLVANRPGPKAADVEPVPSIWACVCPVCDGSAEEPECEGVPCLACDGTGMHLNNGAHVDWHGLGATKAYGLRQMRFRINPGGLGATLHVQTGKTPKSRPANGYYDVIEQHCDGPGRVFFCGKRGTDRRHEVYLGPDGVSCSCEGHTYLTSGKSNQRAYEAGEETHPTHGCVHADALSMLLEPGWLHPDLIGR